MRGWEISHTHRQYIDTGSDGDHEYDPKIKAFKYANGHAGSGSLDGLALFVGINHGVALRADEYPGPDSIYFTDRVDDRTGGDILILEFTAMTRVHFQSAIIPVNTRG